MNFKTLYDLSAEKIDFFKGFLPNTYLFFIIGVGLLISYKKSKNSRKLLVGLGFTFLSSIFLFFFLVGQFLSVHLAKRIMQTGNYFVVEGQPENYHPMPKEGHDEERFDIDGVHFAYSDYVINAAGYNNAVSLGGVIAPNKFYRLTYYKLDKDINTNRILKIEVRQ